MLKTIGLDQRGDSEEFWGREKEMGRGLMQCLVPREIRIVVQVGFIIW